MIGFIKDLWRILRSDRLATVGMFALIGMILVALLAPLIATHDPSDVNERIEGMVARADAEGWSSPEVVGQSPLNGVSVDDQGAALAVGFGGTAVWVEADGDDAPVELPVSTTLRDVALAPDGSGVIVGDDGTLLTNDGGDWRELDGGDENLRGVALVEGGAAIVVGDNGTVLAVDGDEAEPLSVDVEADLHSVAVNTSGTGYAVGDGGEIVAVDGLDLEVVDSPTFRDLAGVSVAEGGATLMVGERGTILELEGDEWVETAAPERRDLRDVSWLDGGSAVTVGERGVVARYDGEEWSVDETGEQLDRSLRGLTGAEDELLAVGTDPYVAALAEPDSEHFFGTTHLGRDIFSQTIWGSRTALLVGSLAALMVVGIGANVGLIAGYFKGRTGGVLMRVVDVAYALPLEPFALVLVLLFRPSLLIVILAIGLITWRTTARIIRAQVLSISERPFIKAARVAGASDWKILYVHIAPNVLPLVFLQLAVAMATAITAEATLSFLGLGPPQTYSWGTILHEARLSGAWRVAWWWIIPPGLFIMVTVVAVFFISRALEVFSNPRLADRTDR